MKKDKLVHTAKELEAEEQITRYYYDLSVKRSKTIEVLKNHLNNDTLEEICSELYDFRAEKREKEQQAIIAAKKQEKVQMKRLNNER